MCLASVLAASNYTRAEYFPITDAKSSTMFLTSVWVWLSTVLFPPVPFEAPANSSLRMIGVGLSRTGTLSTRLALGKLLGGKIYHGFESDMDDRADFWLS